MKFKEGINTRGIQSELILALCVADSVWRNAGEELVITSIADGKHSETSLHYAGCAADIRIRDLQLSPEVMADALKQALGNNPDYDVVVEKDHIHLEWQPKWKPA